MASRALWKGAISFGLVHIPVALHTATSDSGLDFDWLDKRSMDPVGYKRINKTTGEEINKENIVKGIAYKGDHGGDGEGKGQYVVLSDEEIASAYPKTTQTIEIEGFVANTEIPFIYLERPYYIEPINKGQKVYALLRDTLLKTQRIGVARVVIQTKQHLAALVPSGPGLVLNLLRWGEDIRSWEDLNLPPEGAKAAGLTDRELAMAKQLVDDMTTSFDPKAFTDSFKEQIMALVKHKAKEGDLQKVTQPESSDEDGQNGRGAQILDLTELLQRSLRKGGSGAAGDAPKPTAPSANTTAKAKPAAKKTARSAGKQRAA
jgi:DNA end-binding protein Ku